jgi:hypothetical protein
VGCNGGVFIVLCDASERPAVRCSAWLGLSGQYLPCRVEVHRPLPVEARRESDGDAVNASMSVDRREIAIVRDTHDVGVALPNTLPCRSIEIVLRMQNGNRSRRAGTVVRQGSSRMCGCRMRACRCDKHQNNETQRHRPNEKKMSDGGRERASLEVEVWKSSHM